MRKSNNSKAQADAARGSLPGKSGDEAGSDNEDEDESSEGGGPPSKRTLTINGNKGLEHMDPSDKTPTAKSILSSAQAARPANSFVNPRIRRSVGPELALGQAPHPSVPTAAPQAYLSHPVMSVRNLPNFPSIDEAVATSSSPHAMAAREVWGWFEGHLDQLLDSIRSYRFDQFEMHLRTFWQNLTGEYREVVHAPAIAGLMAKADAILYDVGAISACIRLPPTATDVGAGNSRDAALANPDAHPAAVAHEPPPARRQDGENPHGRA